MSDTGFWHGRSGLVVPGLLAAWTTYLLVGVLTMEVPEGTDFPGPRFFPNILIVAGYLLSALLVLHYLRHPEPVDAEDPEQPDAPRWRTFTDWQAVAWCVGGFLVFALTIELLGWIIAAAVLFWCVARGIGSTRPLFDASLSLVVSAAVYLAFAQGLGLNLPAGFLVGGM
ncbi:Tricarboxylate transport protein TctB [Serinicoccus hydrothermalis]|uniref:Tricarboxylate transport protein TctB n=1 Tax=Serinicoccus hydrothermalis TaxID=1758689 RepID=A0A1B1N965_9MICO|nr:tripartite tricarboxylate transporter TctB family protein [Serinicoccus hydrothermalis]ANS77956.1 Tricarboxylate transport protein TctB [Serinicoccus hydrothermalis]